MSLLKNALFYFFILSCFGINTTAVAQNSLECVAFYNLENLFDTEDDTLIRDEEYLPSAGWNEERYQHKLTNMAHIISQIGSDKISNGPSIIGLSEIENRKVLEDLIAQPSLAERGYKIIHFDSPDKRGIDVALLYIGSRFTPLKTKNIPVLIHGPDGKRKYTRDVLHVYGLLDGEPLHVTVNHWPSRWGGEKASRPFREAAAEENAKLISEIQKKEPDANIVIMGDLNDNPSNASVSKILKAKSTQSKTPKGGLYNPMCKKFKKGFGSNAWRDTWSLFDQIIVSENLTSKGSSVWQYSSAHIYSNGSMLQKEGRYKGYPFRTWAGGSYQGGYSDHFPVYLYLKKRQ